MRLRASVGMVSIFSVVCATTAFAHDGHGDPTWSGTPLHYLIELEHAPFTIGALVAVAAVVWIVSRRRERKPIR